MTHHINKTGICKFCGEAKKLIKAHIIPKGFYHGKRMISIGRDSPIRTPINNGEWDNSILCAKCDEEFGAYDDEAQSLFLKNISNYKLSKDGITAYFIPEEAFNFDKLKLFFISLLWRAAMSTRRGYEHLNGLDKRYISDAFNVLKNPELMDDNIFEVLTFKLKSGPNMPPLSKIIISPCPIEMAGIKYFRFVFSGYDFYIKVDYSVSDDKLPDIPIHFRLDSSSQNPISMKLKRGFDLAIFEMPFDQAGIIDAAIEIRNAHEGALKGALRAKQIYDYIVSMQD
jgi:hypothetical protein